MNKVAIQIDPYKNKVSEILMSLSNDSIALYFKNRNYNMSKFYSGNDLIIFEEYMSDEYDLGKPFLFGNLNKILSGKALIVGVENGKFVSPKINKAIIQQNIEVIEDKAFINFFKKELNLTKANWSFKD